ncbi:MAG: HAMP domain-containing protein [Myxococcales bacterium]|nr:HAMP domain-containing protein [Myxococcales bacterium]
MKLSSRLSLVLGAAIVAVVALHALWSTRRALEVVEQDFADRLEARAEQTIELMTAARMVHETPTGDVWLQGPTDDRQGVRWWSRAMRPERLSDADWEAVLGGAPHYVENDDNGLGVLFVPFVGEEEGAVLGAVEVRTRGSDRDARAAMILQEHVMLAALTLLACVAVLVITLRREVGGPIAAMADMARRVGEGDLEARVTSRRRDELGQLAGQLNDMAARLAETRAALEDEAAQRVRAMHEMRHVERLKTVGQLAGGVAHELGTPLNVISGHAKMIEKGYVEGDELIDSARTIGEQCTRMTALIRNVLTFARSRPTPRAQVRIAETVDSALALMNPALRKAQVKVEAEHRTPDLEARGDAGQLEQVLTSVLMNAIQALPEGGTVRIVTGEEPADERGPARAFIAVGDDGVGMSAEVRDRMFEPFFTTRDVGEGAGLGLSTAFGIVRDHKGWFDVQSTPDEGTTVRIHLPVEAPTSKAA